MSDNRNTTLTTPKVLVWSLILTGSILSTLSIFNRYFKRYGTASDIPKNVFKKHFLKGKVTSVGDGDNFHFYHTPGGVLAGWGWFREIPELISIKESSEPFKPKKVKNSSKSFWQKFLFKNQDTASDYFMRLPVKYKNRRGLETISVRLCGVDAPERSHFGNPAQPFSEEALRWLQHTLLGKDVWIKPLSIDQYGRCVAKVLYWSGLFSGYRDISLQMIELGLGTVYAGSSQSAEFDGQELKYRYEEGVAKMKKRGIWSLKHMETPAEYKKRIRS
ncbi:probable Probable endonuclease LCL3 [Saccharomycodes ludwigii]|uniref:Probable endonuclease LCL3 n=1 Tax=Saccharomycodes ludwigii TaxID=36035 RepID=A0A376B3U9_9ASCO|nr:probable Probable endonuclease LCL3 [Saccharomycodes ludwigii]